MNPMSSRVSTAAADYRLNREAYLARVADLHRRRSVASAGGPERARRLHKERKQMLPRERITALLDAGSPFLEFCHLAGEGLYDDVPPGGGIVTGVGLIAGRPCMVIANDATVKGGTYYGITCKKHVRAQRFAWQHRLPCITLVQSGGANLPDQPHVFPDWGQFGTIFWNQIRMSGEGIPQIATVHGSSTAGGAYMPALCDENVIVRNQGRMYLGGPQLVYAATKDVVDEETLGGGEMHSRVSGVTDYLAENDAHAIAIVRDLVSNLGTPPAQRWEVLPARPPKFDPAEIYGIVSRDTRVPTDNREVIARLMDGSEFREFKPLYGETLICGWGRIMGFEIGILCNNGVLFAESAMKAAHFIDLCCKRDIPLLFMADVTGFMVGREAEEAGIAKHGAKMITAMACAEVPKYTLIIGASYGAGYLAMCGRAFKPNAMLMWPSGRAAIMGPDQAATTLAMVKDDIHKREGTSWTNEEREAYMAPTRKTFEDFANAYNFARNTWCDMVIDPVETRPVMAMLLELAGRTPARETEFGVFRM
ncbi:carboxyl transferase domain-containing protein [Algiphilus sp. W345]|uniref:Carboxyl transferase domain-containing protein n=1 Tax=Banduia mediterranea TaxID=3075609 RepID=A0ABU2WEU2_9GAMM|nr:carboxyl transferase domain-containing protein [Algiphilus sp. W345]MDT0496388.1 carboxyl transferase domain-containing protein [Algiphilus sp. W345]